MNVKKRITSVSLTYCVRSDSFIQVKNVAFIIVLSPDIAKIVNSKQRRYYAMR